MRSPCAPIAVCCFGLMLITVGCGRQAGDVAPALEAPGREAAIDGLDTGLSTPEVADESAVELRYMAPAAKPSAPLSEPAGAVGMVPQTEQTVDAEVVRERQRDEADSFSTEAYDRIVENPFQAVMDHPLSTFSIDVDTASYSNVRRYLNHGQLPPPGAVRIEELVNYFPYQYPAPEGDVPFAVNAEIAGCPWEPRHRLIRFGLKGKVIETDERPPSNLVFLLDVSGSMQSTNKLPLVKQALQLLLERLDENDTVSIAVYAGSSGLVLPPTPASRRHTILSAMERLRAGGSTNGGEGIQLAYNTAMTEFIEGGTNRVILCTDGDFNIGMTDQSQLVRMIEEKAKSGVFLSVLGFGMGNYKDSTMEKLADHGNGNYAYIDTFAEARKVLVEQLTGTLVTIAKDVKIQVEFNPAQVAAYRLIGYENRMLAKEDFNDDTKDAGEIGAGHTVTALYEIVPRGVESPALANVDPLKYQQPAGLSTEAMSSEVLTLKLRYKEPDGQTSRKLEFPIRDSEAGFGQASRDFQFASAVAAFGMLLRQSEHKGVATYAAVEEWATPAIEDDGEGYRTEFLELIRTAAGLDGSS
ncbi:MAG: von Willebrand factor type A domain-containing protein [Maioricimonas sp. JB045]